MTPESIWIGEPMEVEVDDLRGRRTGTPVLNATITWDLTTSPSNDGEPLATGSVPHVADDVDGNYLGTIPAEDTAGLTEDKKYFVFINSPNAVLRRINCIAKYRGER